MKISRLGTFSLGLLAVCALGGVLFGERVLAGQNQLVGPPAHLHGHPGRGGGGLRGRGQERAAGLLLHPGDAADAGPALELPGDQGVLHPAGAAEGLLLRPGDHRAVGGREHHGGRSLRGHAGAPPGHPRRRRHQPDRGRRRPGHDHRRRGEAPARPQGHPRAHHRSRGPGYEAPLEFTVIRDEIPLHAVPYLLHGQQEDRLHPAPGLQRGDGLPSRRRARTASASWRRRCAASSRTGPRPSSWTSATTPAASSTRPSRSRTCS